MKTCHAGGRERKEEGLRKRWVEEGEGRQDPFSKRVV